MVPIWARKFDTVKTGSVAAAGAASVNIERRRGASMERMVGKGLHSVCGVVGKYLETVPWGPLASLNRFFVEISLDTYEIFDPPLPCSASTKIRGTQRHSKYQTKLT